VKMIKISVYPTACTMSCVHYSSINIISN